MTTYFGQTEEDLDRNVPSKVRQPFHTTQDVDRHTLCCAGPSAVHNSHKNKLYVLPRCRFISGGVKYQAGTERDTNYLKQDALSLLSAE